MKFIIMGRTGSGKSTFAELLTRQGMSLSKSSTTRKPRSEADKQNYNFLTREEAAAIPASEKLLPTTLNGELYFSARHMLEQSDILILDPKGAKEICNMYPDTCFHIAYICADKQMAMEHAMNRSDNPEAEQETFCRRYDSEAAQFDAFEQENENHTFHAWPYNMRAVHTYKNDFTPEFLCRIANNIIQYKKQHENLSNITQQCLDLGVLEMSEPEKIDLWMEADDTHEKPYVRHVSTDIFADILMEDDEGLANTIRAWCSYGIQLGQPDDLQPVEEPEN